MRNNTSSTIAWKSTVLSLLLLVLLQSRLALSVLQSCQTDADCKYISTSDKGEPGFVPPFSICDEGSCTNPFEGGCLYTRSFKDEDGYSNSLKNRRVCNSNDAQAADGGSTMCRQLDSDVRVDEVRIAANDWESSILLSWIYQIILSEILDVPVTLEFNVDERQTEAGSFYDRNNSFVYSSESYPFDYLKTAAEMVEGQVCDARSKEPCAHMIPEIWDGAAASMEIAIDEGHTIDGGPVGFLGRSGFYIPKFSIERDPSLISYFGLKGKANREKLVETFKTPINWGTYCSKYTKNNCTSEDGVATRPPSSAEAESYFMLGAYTGNFQILPKNNCTTNSECAGHFVNAKCSWTTYAEAQMYWNNISLRSDGPLTPNSGYSNTHMSQIWNAANATKSNVIMWYYSPEIRKQEFVGTSAEYQRVIFPNPTEECVQYRQANLTMDQRCSLEPDVRTSAEVSACDYQSFEVQRAMSTAIVTESKGKDDLLQSPAADFLKLLRLPPTYVDQLLRNWIELESEIPKDYALREAACAWVYTNLDTITNQLPYGYPRKIERSVHGSSRIASILCASVAILCVFFTASVVLSWSDTLVLKLVNVNILVWVTIGAAFVVTGSMAIAIGTFNTTCMLSRWMTVLGYAIELTPIVIKVGTINKLVREARQHRPYALNPKRLDSYFINTILLIIFYLIVTTLIDPVKATPVASMYRDDEVVVTMLDETCSSSRIQWATLDYIIQAALVLSACVLAIQSRDVFAEFNEGQGLALMVYSHLIFLIIRVVADRVISTSLSKSLFPKIDSILKSFDIIFAMAFYFGQKFLPIICPNYHERTARPERTARLDASMPVGGAIAMRTLRVEVNPGDNAVNIVGTTSVERENSELMGSLDISNCDDSHMSHVSAMTE